ncbi:hypothetical protein, partial [Pseudovibrio sp. Ad37]|uniref:hypothetical protein n=1 Tax=Pseudovibrio sp. Ad37 TaxID=989422 RepID=UPI0019D322BE
MRFAGSRIECRMTVLGLGLSSLSDVIPGKRSGDPGSRAALNGFDDKADEVAAREYRHKKRLSLRGRSMDPGSVCTYRRHRLQVFGEMVDTLTWHSGRDRDALERVFNNE